MARSTIKELREKGLSLKKVAKLAGVSASAVDRVLKGERACSKSTERKIRRIIKHHPKLGEKPKKI